MTLKKLITSNDKHILILGVPLVLILFYPIYLMIFLYLFPDTDILLWVMRAGLIALTIWIFLNLLPTIALYFGLKKYFNK